MIYFKLRQVESPVVAMRTDVKQKIIILGFDGMDAGLTDQWLREGKLPNLARLKEAGCFHPPA
jgi:hypothetical protein